MSAEVSAGIQRVAAVSACCCRRTVASQPRRPSDAVAKQGCPLQDVQAGLMDPGPAQPWAESRHRAAER